MALTLIISDLHVAAGCDPQTGKFSPLDDFHADSIIARFLAHYHADSPGAHLVLNGDTFDMTQVLEIPTPEEIPTVVGPGGLDRDRRWYGLRHSIPEVRWKLSRIAQGHTGFFAALGEWIEHGNELHIVIGNHDPELRLPAAQDHLAHLLAQARPGLDPDVARHHLHFYDWYMLQPEQGLYIEHGGQYEPLAYMEGGRLPTCYYNNRYIFNFLEARTPEADNIFPFSRYLAWVLSTDTLPTLAILLRQLPDYVRARRMAREELPPPAPPPLRLPAETEQAICQSRDLQHRHFNRVAWRTTFFTLLAILLNLFSYACPLFAIVTLLTHQVALGLLMLLAWPLARLSSQSIITNYLHRSFISESNFLQEAATAFAPLLAAHNIRTIVLGHTHQPDVAQLPGGVRYFNTGTWVPIFSEDTRLDDREQIYLFVEVRDGNARLLRWRDEAKEPETPIIIDRVRHIKLLPRYRPTLRRRGRR